MPIDLYPIGKSQNCALSQDATLTFPAPVLTTLGWQTGDQIAIRFMLSPLTLLLWRITGQRAGFRLSYLNRTKTGTSGGKLSCTRFVNQYVRPRVTLPLLEIPPVYHVTDLYELALMLETPVWTTVDFSKNGHSSVPTGVTGVYQLLGANGAVLYTGEGDLAGRLRDHLRREELVRAARNFQYLPADKDDAVILEKVLLVQHEQDYGRLPVFNPIRA